MGGIHLLFHIILYPSTCSNSHTHFCTIEFEWRVILQGCRKNNQFKDDMLPFGFISEKEDDFASAEKDGDGNLWLDATTFDKLLR